MEVPGRVGQVSRARLQGTGSAAARLHPIDETTGAEAAPPPESPELTYDELTDAR